MVNWGWWGAQEVGPNTMNRSIGFDTQTSIHKDAKLRTPLSENWHAPASDSHFDSWVIY